MDEFILYCLIEKIILNINSKYTIRFRNLEINKSNQVCLTVKGGEVDDTTRTLNNANYTRHYARLQVIIQSGDDEISLFEALSLKEKLAKTLQNTFNNKYIVQCPLVIDEYGDYVHSDNDELTDIPVIIIKTDLLGEPDYKGFTSQGLPLEVINFKIEYAIGG